MARRKLTDTSHPDLTLTDAYWLTWGDDPQPPMRLKILYLTFEEVAKVGPGAFNVASVCDRLGVTYPMVNHYFGNRDGLLAEGAYLLYQRYIAALWDAVAAAPLDPVERLRAWMWAQVNWTRQMAGWGAVLNYPAASLNVSMIMERTFRQDMQQAFEYNIARLAILVSDVRAGSVSRPTITPGDIDKATLLSDQKLITLTSSVAFSTLGVSVWNAGQHFPSSKIPELADYQTSMIEGHIDHVIGSLTKVD